MSYLLLDFALKKHTSYAFYYISSMDVEYDKQFELVFSVDTLSCIVVQMDFPQYLRIFVI